MPHIHIERRPRKSPAVAILLFVLLLLILAAIAWYFIAGPGRSRASSVSLVNPGQVKTHQATARTYPDINEFLNLV